MYIVIFILLKIFAWNFSFVEGLLSQAHICNCAGVHYFSLYLEFEDFFHLET